MASNALVQTRIDSAIKEEAAAVLATMGLTVSDAVRLLLTRVAHDHTMPFDILIPNSETVAAMRDARQGKLASATTIKEFQDAMNAED
jgi:DNA-damage-inducible protein J